MQLNCDIDSTARGSTNTKILLSLAVLALLLLHLVNKLIHNDMTTQIAVFIICQQAVILHLESTLIEKDLLT